MTGVPRFRWHAALLGGRAVSWRFHRHDCVVGDIESEHGIVAGRDINDVEGRPALSSIDH
jgi:hypothetical protein